MMIDSYFICKSPCKNSAILKRTEPGHVILSEFSRPICGEKVIESLLLDFETCSITTIDDVGYVLDPWGFIWIDCDWKEITEEIYKKCKNNFKICEKVYKNTFFKENKEERE